MGKLAATAAALALLCACEAQAQWRYSALPNLLSDRETGLATSTSVNAHHFKFPYQGGTRALLILREPEEEGGEPEAMIQITRGQLMCGEPSCRVRVRFDDDVPLDYHAIPPADADPTLAFIEPGRYVIQQTRTARRVRIEVTVFHEGTRVFEFNVAGLKWPPPPRR